MSKDSKTGQRTHRQPTPTKIIVERHYVRYIAVNDGVDSIDKRTNERTFRLCKYSDRYQAEKKVLHKMMDIIMLVFFAMPGNVQTTGWKWKCLQWCRQNFWKISRRDGTKCLVVTKGIK